MYADDTTLYCNVNQNITAEVINGELIKVNQWLRANKLSFNVTKTKFMVFHMHNKLSHTLIYKLMAIKSNV